MTGAHARKVLANARRRAEYRGDWPPPVSEMEHITKAVSCNPALVEVMGTRHPAVQEAVIREVAANLAKAVGPAAGAPAGGGIGGQPAIMPLDAGTKPSFAGGLQDADDLDATNRIAAARHQATGRFISRNRPNAVNGAPAYQSASGLFAFSPAQHGAA
jgi:hypothetical protein